MAARERGRRREAWPLVAALLVASLGTPGRVAGGDAILSNYRAFDSERAWNHAGKAAVPAPRLAEAEAELAAAAGRASSVAGEPGHKGKGSRMTLMLDLDKTCLFGNDGNDMGLCLQYMGKSREVVQELYDRIINPNLRKTYDNYATKTQHTVDVVIYTRRPRLLEYTSCLNGNVMPLRYPDVWHDGTQLYIPPIMRTAEEVRAQYRGPPLREEEEHDITKSLERLMCARDAVTRALGLRSPPVVVITATAKSIDATARHLAFNPATAVLYDDNEELAVGGDERVVIVDPFTSLAPAQRKDILGFMQRVLPAEELETELLRYLESAPPAEQPLAFGRNGKCAWWLPKVTGRGMRSWKIVRHLLSPPTSVSLRSSAAAQLQAQAQTQTVQTTNTADPSNVLKSPGGRKKGITRSRSMQDMQEVTQGVGGVLGMVGVAAEAQQNAAPPAFPTTPASPASPASQASKKLSKVRTQNSQDFDPEYMALPEPDQVASEVSAPLPTVAAPPAPSDPLATAGGGGGGGGATDALPRDEAPPAVPHTSHTVAVLTQEEMAAPPEQEEVAALFFWKPDEEFQPPPPRRGQSPPPPLRQDAAPVPASQHPPLPPPAPPWSGLREQNGQAFDPEYWVEEDFGHGEPVGGKRGEAGGGLASVRPQGASNMCRGAQGGASGPQDTAAPDSAGGDEADSEMWGKMRGAAGSAGGGGGGGREGDGEIDHIESEGEGGMWGRMKLPWRGRGLNGRGAGGVGLSYQAAVEAAADTTTSAVSSREGEDEAVGGAAEGGEGEGGVGGQGADTAERGDGDIGRVKNNFRVRSYFSQLDLRRNL